MLGSPGSSGTAWETASGCSSTGRRRTARLAGSRSRPAALGSGRHDRRPRPRRSPPADRSRCRPGRNRWPSPSARQGRRARPGSGRPPRSGPNVPRASWLAAERELDRRPGRATRPVDVEVAPDRHDRVGDKQHAAWVEALGAVRDHLDGRGGLGPAAAGLHFLRAGHVLGHLEDGGPLAPRVDVVGVAAELHGHARDVGALTSATLAGDGAGSPGRDCRVAQLERGPGSAARAPPRRQAPPPRSRADLRASAFS